MAAIATIPGYKIISIDWLAAMWQCQIASKIWIDGLLTIVYVSKMVPTLHIEDVLSSRGIPTYQQKVDVQNSYAGIISSESYNV